MARPSRVTLIHTVYTTSYGGSNGGGINFSIRSRDEGTTAAIVDDRATLACTEACGLVYDFRLTTSGEQRKERQTNCKRRALYFIASYPFMVAAGFVTAHTEGVAKIAGLVVATVIGIFSLAQIVLLFKKTAKYQLNHRPTKAEAWNSSGDLVSHTAQLH